MADGQARGAAMARSESGAQAAVSRVQQATQQREVELMGKP